jgi:hypothetical protein
MEAEKVAHEAAMNAHLAQQAMAATLAASSITKEAIAAGQKASDAILIGEESSAPMHD